jgi:beta-galactosidase
VVASEQFALPIEAPHAEKSAAAATEIDLDLARTDSHITVTGADFRVEFSTENGALTSYTAKGIKLVTGPLEPNLWRAPIDNDNGSQMNRRLRPWRRAASRRTTQSVASELVETSAVVTVEQLVTRTQSPLRTRYTVSSDGAIHVAVRIVPNAPLPEMPRFGVQFSVPREYSLIEWYGRGPHENYIDRISSAPVSRYRSTIQEFVHEYVRPQENGNRTGVRWASLSDDVGRGILIEGGPTMEFSAWPYTQADLEAARHVNELPDRDEITVNISGAQMGVGGDNSWGALPYAKYTLPAVERQFEFTLRPLGESGSADASVARE